MQRHDQAGHVSCPALFTADVRFAGEDKLTHNVKMCNGIIIIIVQIVATAPGSTRDLQMALAGIACPEDLHRQK